MPADGRRRPRACAAAASASHSPEHRENSPPRLRTRGSGRETGGDGESRRGAKPRALFRAKGCSRRVHGWLEAPRRPARSRASSARVMRRCSPSHQSSTTAARGDSHPQFSGRGGAGPVVVVVGRGSGWRDDCSAVMRRRSTLLARAMGALACSRRGRRLRQGRLRSNRRSRSLARGHGPSTRN